MVTYHPAFSTFRNIRAIAMQVRTVFVIDNTPGSYRRFFRIVGGYPNVKVLRLGVNTGIGAALNIGMQLARDEGFEWAITLDQDSFLAQGAVRQLRGAVLSLDTAIVAPAIRDAFTRKLILRGTSAGKSEHPAVVITSGNLVRIEAWESVDGFDWQFFIDMVDFDFCLRLAAKGWIIRRHADTELLHRWGQIRRITVFGSYGITMRTYPPFRRFFQARNSVILLRRHAIRSAWWCLGHASRLLLVSLKIHILEEASRKAWYKGLRAGWRKPGYELPRLHSPKSPARSRPVKLGGSIAGRLASHYRKRLKDSSTVAPP